MVKENPDEYADVQDIFKQNNKEEKYLGLQIYEKKTVKSCFKEYDLLCVEFEQKAML